MSDLFQDEIDRLNRTQNLVLSLIAREQKAADALEAAEKRITELEHAYEVLAHSCSDEAEVAEWKLHAAEAKFAAIDALCDIAMDPVGYGTYFAQQVKAILHPEES